MRATQNLEITGLLRPDPDRRDRREHSTLRDLTEPDDTAQGQGFGVPNMSWMALTTAQIRLVGLRGVLGLS